MGRKNLACAASLLYAPEQAHWRTWSVIDKSGSQSLEKFSTSFGEINMSQVPICSPSMRMPLRALRWQPHLSRRILRHRGRRETHPFGRIWMFLLQIVWDPWRSPSPSSSMVIRSIATSSLRSVPYPNQCRRRCGQDKRAESRELYRRQSERGGEERKSGRTNRKINDKMRETIEWEGEKKNEGK